MDKERATGIAKWIRHKLMTEKDEMTEKEKAFEEITPIEFDFYNREWKREYTDFLIGKREFRAVFNSKVALYEISEHGDIFMKISPSALYEMGVSM